jgi:hypothetical protein
LFVELLVTFKTLLGIIPLVLPASDSGGVFHLLSVVNQSDVDCKFYFLVVKWFDEKFDG